jgi:hypothetical protein
MKNKKLIKIIFLIVLVIGNRHILFSQKIFNQLTYNTYSTYVYNGFICPTFKDGTFVLSYSKDSFLPVDSGKQQNSFYKIRAFDTSGNIVAKRLSLFKDGKTGNIYNYEYFESYDDKLYGIGLCQIPISNNSSIFAKYYTIVSEIDKKTLSIDHSKDYLHYICIDTLDSRAALWTSCPIIENNKFYFGAFYLNIDTLLGTKGEVYHIYFNFNFKEKRFYSKSVYNPKNKPNGFLTNAIKVSKDRYASFPFSVSEYYYRGRIDTVFYFDKEFNYIYTDTLFIKDKKSMYAIYGGYTHKDAILRGNDAVHLSSNSVFLYDTSTKKYDTIVGLHKYIFRNDSFFYDKVIERTSAPHGFKMGAGKSMINTILDPTDSGYYISFYDRSLFISSSFVIYKFDKNLNIKWKRLYQDTINAMYMTGAIENNISMGYDYKNGGVLIPFDANDSGYIRNMFLLWVDRNGNPLKIGGKDLTGSSIVDFVSKIDLQIYPNPCKEYLNISFKDKENMKNTYRIYSLDGKLMQDGSLNSEKIDISFFSKGTYVLQVLSPDFEIMGNKRFIKE